MATVEVKIKITGRIKTMIDKFISDLSVISGKEVRAIAGILRSRRNPARLRGLTHKRTMIKKIITEHPRLSANNVARMIRRNAMRAIASNEPWLTLNTEG